jgi:hypothetical protein
VTQRHCQPCIAVLAVVAAAVLPSPAFAGHTANAKRPASGVWTMTSYGEGEIQSGSLKVASNDRSVSAVQLVIGPNAETACGTGTLTVAGALPMHVVDGGHPKKPEYIVGRGDVVSPGSAYKRKPITVRVTVNGMQLAGQLDLIFRTPRGGAGRAQDFGEISYTTPTAFAGGNGGGCDFQVDIAKH